MAFNEQDVLLKIREIYIQKLGMFSEDEVDDDTYVGKMNGYKVDGDDLSIFAKGVLDYFNIPLLQSDWDSLGTLREVSHFVIVKLKEKSRPQPKT